MSLQICMVLCKQAARTDINDVISDLVTRFPQLPAPTNAGSEGTVLSLSIGAVDCFLTPISAPYPWSDLEGPCQSSVLWKDALIELKDHQSHLLITVMGEASELALSTVLSRFTASVMAVTSDALGVYWANAAMIVPKAIFTEFIEEILPDAPPLTVWVDFRVGWNDEKTSSGFTTGMAALGHKEFEVLSSPDKPSDLRQRFETLAYHVLEHGPVFNDGDTVGANANEKITVSIQKSNVGQKGDVILLKFPAKKKKGIFGLFDKA